MRLLLGHAHLGLECDGASSPAKVFDLTLATADELLLKAKDFSVMPNR